MNPAPRDPNVVRRDVEPKAMKSDHGTLRAFMTRINDLLVNLARGESSQEGETRRVIDQFRGFLLRRLEREEASRMLEQAAEAEPRLADRVQSLLLEHADLRSGVEDLAAAASGSDWSELRVRFAAFRSMLSAHEEAENGVLMEAYQGDIGG